MSNDAPSFGELIEKFQETPPGKLKDVANPFQARMPNGEEVVDLEKMPGKGMKIPGGTDYDYEAHVEFLALPEGAADYERILNQALRGEAIIRSEDKTFSKDGDFLVVVQYLTFKPKAKKKRISEGSDRDRHD